MADTFKYRAFISYSHKDRAWGDWLHKALEGYRVPGRLVGALPTERRTGVTGHFFVEVQQAKSGRYGHCQAGNQEHGHLGLILS